MITYHIYETGCIGNQLDYKSSMKNNYQLSLGFKFFFNYEDIF